MLSVPTVLRIQQKKKKEERLEDYHSAQLFGTVWSGNRGSQQQSDQ